MDIGTFLMRCHLENRIQLRQVSHRPAGGGKAKMKDKFVLIPAFYN